MPRRNFSPKRSPSAATGKVAAILITVDNTGVPKHVRDEVVARLAKRKIDPSRIAICSSHSHTAPYLAGYLPMLFGEPLPPEHQTHVERYTRELTDKIEAVALEALKDRKPGKLAWGQTKAAFAANRRIKGGPVDHDLPVLVATDRKGNLRALLVNYACHCTTLGGEFNQVCGDWAGYAQEYLERDHPGATVLVAIGCGADANPEPRTGIDLAKRHGQEIAQGVNELLGFPLTPPSPPVGEERVSGGRVRGMRKLTPIRGALELPRQRKSNCRSTRYPRARTWSAKPRTQTFTSLTTPAGISRGSTAMAPCRQRFLISFRHGVSAIRWR